MQTNHFGRSIIVKMAPDSVARVNMQFVERVRFGDDRVPDRTGYKSALRRIFHNKNYFVHPGSLKWIEC